MSLEVLNGAQEFLASDLWWSQILDFMLSKCEPFKSSETYSFEEYKIYLEYVSFLENLIDSEMCKNINIAPGNFEDAIIEGVKISNPVAVSVMETLNHAFDFQSFCSDMVAHNERIEKEVENVMNQDYDVDSTPEGNIPLIKNPVQSSVHEPMQPIPTSIHPPLQSPRFQISQPSGVSHDIRAPRSPRYAQNKLSMAMPMAIALRARLRGCPNQGGLPAILSRKKESLQTMQSSTPMLKIPKAGGIKLPPLGKSPRF